MLWGHLTDQISITWSERKDKSEWSLSSCDSCWRTWSENMIIREVKRWGSEGGWRVCVGGSALSSHIDMLCGNPYFCQLPLRCSGGEPQPTNLPLYLSQRWPTFPRLPYTQTLCNWSPPQAGKTSLILCRDRTRQHMCSFVREGQNKTALAWCNSATKYFLKTCIRLLLFLCISFCLFIYIYIHLLCLYLE